MNTGFILDMNYCAVHHLVNYYSTDDDMTNNIAQQKTHILLTQAVPAPIDEILRRDYEVHRLYQASEPQKCWQILAH
jgi:hypothetical protein